MFLVLYKFDGMRFSRPYKYRPRQYHKTAQMKWSYKVGFPIHPPNFTEDVKPHITDSPKYLPQRPVLAPLLFNIPQL